MLYMQLVKPGFGCILDRRPIDDGIDIRPVNSAKTHGAGFSGGVDGASGEVDGAHIFARFADSRYFGMGRDVRCEPHFVVGVGSTAIAIKRRS